MNNDSKLIFENYVDGITKRKSQLSNYIYDLVKYGIPSKEEFIKIRQQLHDEVARIEKRGTPPTPEEKEFGRELIKKIQLYRKDNPDDPPVLYPDRDKKQEQEEDMFKSADNFAGAQQNYTQEEESPFHYDPSHGLMQAANQINDILKSSYNDEATEEHIEKMALKILGPQSEYRDYHEFNKALEGVKALLNRYIVVQMN